MSTTDRDHAGADEDRSYAVAVTLAEEGWSVTELDDAALDSLAGAVSRLRRLRAERACFALLNIDDDYFIILRPVPGAVHALLSDATAAVTDDIAAEVLEELDEEVPDLDEDEAAEADPWPEGDLGLLADLGLPEDVLAVICEDANLWASEQLHAVAQVLGFDDELAEVTGYGVDDD